MARKILLLLGLLFLSSFACGDGCVMFLTYDEYGVERDVLLSGEGSQVSVIDYSDGIEDMLISVKVSAQGEGMLWIFPIPADPLESEIDIVYEFPELEGFNVKNKLGGRITEVEGWSLISQIWSFFPAVITNPDLVKREFFHAQERSEYYDEFAVGLSAGGDFYLEEPDYGVRVYHRIDKLGLSSELLTARYGEGLSRYLSDKNLTLPRPVVDEIDSYIGGDYAFVVSWVSDPDEFGGQDRDLALRVRFPTDKLYYPLKLTSVYGSRTIPITIYFKGHVNPRLYDSIRQGSDVDYFISTYYNIPSELDSFFGGNTIVEGLKYTRLNINTQSSNLKQDLWASNLPPISVAFADFGMELPFPLFELLLFALFSCLASVLAGWVVFGRGVKPLHFIILGFSNLTSFIGFSLASYGLLCREKTDEKLPKKIVLFFTPLLISLLFLILLKIVDTPMSFMLSILASLFFLLLLVYFLSTMPLISFSLVAESPHLKNAFYLTLCSITFLLFTFSFVIPWAIAGDTLLPGGFVIAIPLIPIFLLFIRPLRERLKQTRCFKLIVVFFCILALTPILIYLYPRTYDMPYGSPLRTILELSILGFFYLLMLLTFLSLLIYPASIIYSIYLSYSIVFRRMSALNHRVFYSGVLVNTLFVFIIIAKFVLDLLGVGYYVGLGTLIYLAFLLPLALIYLSSTTSLWYFILARRELTEQHRFFLFIVLFSILFVLISFLSTEILMLEYRPL